MHCPMCGGTMIGDGFGAVIHCENVDRDIWGDYEPDAKPIYCDEVPVKLQVNKGIE